MKAIALTMLMVVFAVFSFTGCGVDVGEQTFKVPDDKLYLYTQEQEVSEVRSYLIKARSQFEKGNLDKNTVFERCGFPEKMGADMWYYFPLESEQTEIKRLVVRFSGRWADLWMAEYKDGKKEVYR